jgi:uncharacterized protein with HEPN domain
MRGKLGDKQRLQHILDAIDEVEAFVEGCNFGQFVTNSMMFSACLHKLEVIGEASNRLTQDLQDASNEIPWRSINGLRNMIAHEYFGIDQQTIWNIIQSDLPTLRPKLVKLLESIE